MQLISRVEFILLLVVVVLEEVGIRMRLGGELVAPVLFEEEVEEVDVPAVHLDAFVDWPDGGVVEGH